MDSTETQYKEAIDWLFSQLPMFSRVGAPAYKPGLQTTEALDRLFGHPHEKFKSIHIAGTNGKGSTSHLLAATLQAQGYKTGLYTSPHLVDFRERIRINGEMIPKGKVVDFVTRWQKMTADLHPSFFELTMMMAFDWFASEGVDFAVIEVGMGGRLDSTNIIKPELCVITNISFDHTQFLGDTLEAIAREKAGIIKEGIPVVIGEAQGEIKRVFLETAEKKGASITFASDNTSEIRLECTEGNAPSEQGRTGTKEGWTVTLRNGDTATLPLKGEYQRHNLRTVITALDAMRRNGIEISEASIKTGIENVERLTGLQGRWQIIRENPAVICDTGHNVGGISQNMETLRRDYPDRRIKFVVGFVNDKDVSHIVDLFPADGEYYFTQASIPRAMKAEEVAAIFKSSGKTGEVIHDVKAAFGAALGKATPEDVIYVGGSTFVVADFLAP